MTGGGEQALLDELLARQARSHGLHGFTPCAADSAEPALREELAEEAARLGTFAGLRAAEESVAFARGGGEDGSKEQAGTGPLSAFADVSSCAEELEALGLELLKQELHRLGLKCGGTLQARARRGRAATLRARASAGRSVSRSARPFCT